MYNKSIQNDKVDTEVYDMKKWSSLLWICVVVMLLAACGGDLPETVPATEPTVTTEQVETTPQTEPSETTCPTLPWTPMDGEVLSYEAYFSTVREYDVDVDNLNGNRSWGGYSIRYGEGELLVTNVYGTVLHTVPNVDTNIDWVNCDDSWIYGIRNGDELLRIDYYGQNEEILYHASPYSIGMESAGHVYLAEECVLFFAACSEQGSRICRLYIPELRLDILAESDAALIQLAGVLSNHEVLWNEENVAFAEFLSEMTEAELAKYPWDDLHDRVSAEYRIPKSFRHYENTATGESYTLPSYGNYFTERTQENIAINGEKWWDDFR